MTIKEIKELLAGNPDAEDMKRLALDSRKGVQRLLSGYRKRRTRLKEKREQFQHRFAWERKFWRQGKLCAGIDEVGRGPLAGPIVAAAVILPQDFDLISVNDSKKLRPARRLRLYPLILSRAVSVGIGMKDAETIDRINIYQADRLAMRDAVLHLGKRPQELLVDAMDVPLKMPQTKLIKGDSKSNSIAAASIVAKVFRDKLMDDYAKIYPQYGFTHNAGYGTADHIRALRKYGPCPIHRKSFAPVSDFYK